MSARGVRVGMRLVNAKLAAYHCKTSVDMVRYWARKGYIKRHYILAADGSLSKYNYLVDLDECLKQLELTYARKHASYNNHWMTQPRGPKGGYVKRDSDGS